eukprot:6188080-Pleurochrysis_carterae.AAC.1
MLWNSAKPNKIHAEHTPRCRLLVWRRRLLCKCEILTAHLLPNQSPCKAVSICKHPEIAVKKRVAASRCPTKSMYSWLSDESTHGDLYLHKDLNSHTCARARMRAYALTSRRACICKLFSMFVCNTRTDTLIRTHAHKHKHSTPTQTRTRTHTHTARTRAPTQSRHEHARTRTYAHARARTRPDQQPSSGTRVDVHARRGEGAPAVASRRHFRTSARR